MIKRKEVEDAFKEYKSYNEYIINKKEKISQEIFNKSEESMRDILRRVGVNITKIIPKIKDEAFIYLCNNALNISPEEYISKLKEYQESLNLVELEKNIKELRKRYYNLKDNLIKDGINTSMLKTDEAKELFKETYKVDDIDKILNIDDTFDILFLLIDLKKKWDYKSCSFVNVMMINPKWHNIFKEIGMMVM